MELAALSVRFTFAFFFPVLISTESLSKERRETIHEMTRNYTKREALSCGFVSFRGSLCRFFYPAICYYSRADEKVYSY